MIGLNIGVLIQAAPQIFGVVMGEMSALMAAGVLTPGRPSACELADGPNGCHLQPLAGPVGRGRRPDATDLRRAPLTASGPRG